MQAVQCMLNIVTDLCYIYNNGCQITVGRPKLEAQKNFVKFQVLVAVSIEMSSGMLRYNRRDDRSCKHL